MTVIPVAAGILLCILLSGFFSGAEMAYSACNKMRLQNEAEEGDERAGIALFISEHFDDALSAILIGNNLVNIACSSLSAVFVILVFGSDRYTGAAAAVIMVLVIIFGETIPKITAKTGANTLAVRYAWPVRILMLLLRPLVLLVVGLVHLLTGWLPGESAETGSGEKVEELQSIIETAEDEDVLDREESKLVQAAIDFSDISAYEAMTARVDVLALDIEDSREETMRVIERAMFTRIPVYEGSIDHVIGILHVNRYLKELTENQEVDLRALLMEPCYVYKTMKLPAVLKAFRRAKQHLAVVVDEYGGTLGIISMEDVMEQVVGDIWDETDTVETEVVKRTESEYEIDGDMPVSDFLDLLNLREEDLPCESETVGGFTIESFGAFPAVGSSIHVKYFTLTVLAMDERRVERVLVKIDRKSDAE